MKKRLVLLAMLLLIPLGGTWAAEDPDGFRGINWGTDISVIKGMRKDITYENGSVGYHRRGEHLAIGTAELKHVEYLFYRDRFFKTKVDAPFEFTRAYDKSYPGGNFLAMRRACFTQFGTPTETFEDSTAADNAPQAQRIGAISRCSYRWDTPQVVVRLSADRTADTVELTISHKSTLLRMREDYRASIDRDF